MFDVLILYFCVGVGDVGGEIRCIIVSVEGFTGDVLPGAGEIITRANKFESGASGEAGETRAASEHVPHIRHILRIQRRQIQACQARAAVEHTPHVRYFLCIQRS